MTPALSTLINDYLAAQRFPDAQEFLDLRSQLLKEPVNAVTQDFAHRLAAADENSRCRLLERYALLYQHRSVDLLLRWINDASSTVRWVVCGCLNDFGNESATDPLRHLMLHDADCQIRGEAASALGSIGSLRVLPDLDRVGMTDHDVDQLGHTPASTAKESITNLLRRWAMRQVRGTPQTSFSENLSPGMITGTILAEGLPDEPNGQVLKLPRYSELPRNVFGFGLATKLELKTTLKPIFEVHVEYTCDEHHLERIFIYQPLDDSSGELDCAITTIVDVPTARPFLRPMC